MNKADITRMGFIVAFLSTLAVLYIVVINGFLQVQTGITVNNYINAIVDDFTKIRELRRVNFANENGTYMLHKGAIEERTNGYDLAKRARNATDYEIGHQELCKNSWQQDYTKFHKHLINSNHSRFLVYRCSRGGWGNRIRELLVSFHFAVVTRRAFIINCPTPSPLYKFLSPRHINWSYKINMTRLTIRKGYVIYLKDIKNHSDSTTLEKMLTYSVEESPRLKGQFYTYLANLLRYDLSVWPNMPQMLGCNFYYLFKKSDTLQESFTTWKKELGFNDNIVIALHIREGDSVFHGNNKNDKRFASLKEMDLSFDCVTAVEKKIEEKYQTKKIIWFLAADSEKMKTYAKEKFGSKVKTITGPIEHIGRPRKGNEESGMLSMFLDFFLIQEADYRLYLTHSTFDNAIDFITLGKSNTGGGLHPYKRECSFPPSLKNA